MNLTKEINIKQIENKNLLKVKLESIKIAGILNRTKFQKRGIEEYSIPQILYRIMAVLYMNKRLAVLWSQSTTVANFLKETGKDCYYRFLKNERFNWRKLLIRISMKLINPLENLSERKDRVLILDDTPNKKRGKHIELLSWQYDHSTHSYYRGYAQLHLGWSDGNSYMPIDFCIKVSPEKRTNTSEKQIDKRTNGARRRKESMKTKLTQGIEMIQRAYSAGIDVGYVVYDSWFAKPSFILSVFRSGYNSVCQLVRNDRIWKVRYSGNVWKLKDLYRLLKKEKRFKKVQIGNIRQRIASIIVQHENGLELKLVFCQTGKKKEWIVIASTDVNQSDYQVLETYAKRWGIENFFKECKQDLKLGKEQSTDFDVQISMTTIRLIAYALAASIGRDLLDERTMGELFEIISNEFSRLNLDREILDLIFNYVLELVSHSKHIRLTLRPVFDALLDSFTTHSIIYEKAKVA